MKVSLQEGIDFYYCEDGYLVLTGAYLKNRGFCCGNGCRHCPYGYEMVPEPMKSDLLTRAGRQRAKEKE